MCCIIVSQNKTKHTCWHEYYSNSRIVWRSHLHRSCVMPKNGLEILGFGLKRTMAYYLIVAIWCVILECSSIQQRCYYCSTFLLSAATRTYCLLDDLRLYLKRFQISQKNAWEWYLFRMSMEDVIERSNLTLSLLLKNQRIRGVLLCFCA